MTPSTTTYALLGMLASRPWTGYELTQQVRRSLRFVWPISEGHLYREQRRLVELGWATVEQEPVGRRTRKRYAITEAGRGALHDWAGSDVDEPHFQVEGVLRAFYGDSADPAQLVRSLRATAEAAAEMRRELLGYVREYVSDDGPLALLEAGGGLEGGRQVVHGRTAFPERLPAVALAVDATVRLLDALEEFAEGAQDEVATWDGATPQEQAAATRVRLEGLLDRAR